MTQGHSALEYADVFHIRSRTSQGGGPSKARPGATPSTACSRQYSRNPRRNMTDHSSRRGRLFAPADARHFSRTSNALEINAGCRLSSDGLFVEQQAPQVLNVTAASLAASSIFDCAASTGPPSSPSRQAPGRRNPWCRHHADVCSHGGAGPPASTALRVICDRPARSANATVASPWSGGRAGAAHPAG